MNNNEYLDSLMAELAAQGVEPPKNNNNNVKSTDDKELEIIANMERVTGKKFSDEQRKILEHHGNACILACAGSGKALVNGTGVLTPNGYVPIETLKVEDKVFNENGHVQEVLGVFPQGKKKVYNVRFNGNIVIKCCKDHLWTIRNKNCYWQTMNTLDIKSILDKEKAIDSDFAIGIPNIYLDNFNGLGLGEYYNAFKSVIGDLSEFFNTLIEESKTCEILQGFVSRYIDDVNIGFKDATQYLSEYLFGKTLLIKNKDFCNKLELALNFFGITADKEDTEEGTVITFKYYDKEIVDIEETEDYAEMTCIKVSGLSELFMTEHCIVTHNTTISVNLIAKRILTGEIKDTNKLIYTTFSKAGAEVMNDRLTTLLNQLGMGHIKVQVRTLHSFFLSVIRTFGLNKRIINASERSKMVRQACKDAEYTLKDDDLMIIDNLLSYQMNNLLTNKKLVDSYVNTLEDLTVEKYNIINSSFRKQKDDGNCMDYDDMQYYLWLWLVKWQKSENAVEKQTAEAVRNYCKAVYTDFYIDEAQDVSKIQFEIIKAIVSDPDNKNRLDKNLVFIGDDDQCLLGGTLVKTSAGDKKIEDIKEGDKILSFNGNNIIENKVIGTHSTGINNSVPLIKIETKSGKSFICTADHKVMVKIPSRFKDDTINVDDSQYVVNDLVREIIDNSNNKENELCKIKSRLNVVGYSEKLPHFGKGVRTESDYVVTLASSIRDGFIFGEYCGNNIADDEVTRVEVIDKTKLSKSGAKVYCLNLANNHNYFANNLLTHNCIYQWRGSDPSIILTIGAKFNMQTFVLSTNYRCLNEIVDYAATGIKCNNSRFDKSMNAFNNGGSVKIYPSIREDLCTLSIAALNQIKYWLNNGDKVSDIAVLSRNNFHLALLSNMLLREGIYCNMTEDMKLTKSYMYNDVKDIISLSEPSWKAELTAKLLWKMCRYMGANNSRIIASFQDSCALSLEDTLGWLIKHFVNKDLEFSKKLNITMQVEQQMQYQMGKLSSEATNDMCTLYKTLSKKGPIFDDNGNEVDIRIDKITNLLYQYLQATSFMYKSKDKNRSITGLVQYVINLMKKDGVDKMLDFMRVTEQLEGGRMVIPGEKLTLTTIHSAKGREWKDVIMFGCDNVSQPSFDGIYGMIQDDIPMSDIFENIDEERRLFYVGNTRAKENLFVITYMQPSIFILEALGAFKDKNGGNNATIVELVSDNQWQEKYKSLIQEKILNTDSKYFYNPEDYKVKDN